MPFACVLFLSFPAASYFAGCKDSAANECNRDGKSERNPVLAAIKPRQAVSVLRLVLFSVTFQVFCNLYTVNV